MAPTGFARCDWQPTISHGSLDWQNPKHMYTHDKQPLTSSCEWVFTWHIRLARQLQLLQYLSLATRTCTGASTSKTVTVYIHKNLGRSVGKLIQASYIKLNHTLYLKIFIDKWFRYHQFKTSIIKIKNIYYLHFRGHHIWIYKTFPKSIF